MTARPFAQLDVFTTSGLSGNPLAVVLDGDGLTTEEMAAFARWTNLSETTFVVAPSEPSADYAVRIFTPSEELPFAGHPTIGTCRAWLDATGDRSVGSVRQECGVGLVELRVDGDRLAFRAPPRRRSGPLDADLRAAIARSCGLDDDEIVEAAWVDNGPGWAALLVTSAERVLELEPDIGDLPEPVKVGLVGFHPASAEDRIEVRALFRGPAGDHREDPVTGSLNASVAQWLIETGRIETPYTASQGERVRRSGRVFVDQDDDGEVWVGGRATTIVSGTVVL